MGRGHGRAGTYASCAPGEEWRFVGAPGEPPQSSSCRVVTTGVGPHGEGQGIHASRPCQPSQNVGWCHRWRGVDRIFPRAAHWAQNGVEAIRFYRMAQAMAKARCRFSIVMTVLAAQRMEAACRCGERFATGGPRPWRLRRRPGARCLDGRHRARSGEISRQTISAVGFDVTRARSMSMVESPPVCDAVNLKLLSVVAALASWQLQIRNRPSMIGCGELSNG